MKTNLSKRRNAGMTLFEVGVVIVLVVVLAVILLPMLKEAKVKAAKITCAGNLKLINMAFAIWKDDHNGVFPMGVSVTNGGSMEAVQTGDVVRNFTVMSNVLNTPFNLCCPGDVGRSPASNFPLLTSSNISYFVSVETTNDLNPMQLTSGDANFERGGTLVKSGFCSFSTNGPVVWRADRHFGCGNLGMADGSVQSSTSSNLQTFLEQTGFATNRFAIP